MKRFLLPFIILVIFMLESIFVNFVAMQPAFRDWLLSPRFVLIALVFMTIYINRKQAMIFGIVFGFLYDIAFTDVLGIYALGLPAVCYIVSQLIKIWQNNLLVVLLICLIAVAIIEFYVYGINTIIGVSDMLMGRFLAERFYATLILNAIFTVIFALPLQKCFQYFSLFYAKER
ncbi:rod shape-determining protein MreD [Priestia flexa]|uniref:Rod shape-determining protein MreD n=2 Tax=Priestia TaxID=2800373 RepID=A0A0V8JN78_9BACI|nr:MULTISPECIES: rod shape-determining protein MreD [Bacillaceae]AQX53609.1 rod shape-determining protein MreD [Priestia flexa]KSU88510.1 rod shape-determining protein MreD [Priestia veravalensis]KZB92780.1 rod shape-determining protein MreD [Bacillus sp. VT 712]MCA1200799.1 rod shape-determining protein MreD [Priestia flexa]MCG7311712.1 rod shape-determining protein MreD [Priestia flexa]